MQTRSSCRCRNSHQAAGRGIFAFLPGLVIALLPKCPFCVLSLSSAITVCSAKNISGYAPDWTSWISIAFAVLTIALVFYNFKGVRTWIALLLIAAGSALVIYSELSSGLLQPYYAGSMLLITGVWVNGSLYHFIRKIIGRPALSHG